MTDSTAGAERQNLKKPRGEDARVKIDSRLALLSLAALGVVFGDISTSPIYANVPVKLISDVYGAKSVVNHMTIERTNAKN